MTKNHMPSPLRWLPVFALGIALVMPSHALINPNYTPVNLVKDAKVLVRLELGAVQDDGSMASKVTQVLKGAAPAKLAVTIDRQDADLLEALVKAMGGRDTATALYLAGDSFEGAVEGGGQKKSPTAAICIGATWFSLVPAPDGAMRLVEDALDLKAVWSGGEESLAKTVTYILADPKPDVPVAGEVTWRESLQVATANGRNHGCLAVQLVGGPLPGILLLGEKGDRYYLFDAKTKKFGDLTAKLKLESRTRLAAAGDFDGNGRVDLASWDGKQLRVLLMSPDDTLKAGDAPAWTGDGVGLAACAAADGRTGLIVSTPGWPVAVTLGKDGVASSRAVCTGVFAKDRWGVGGPCVVADFDNDGLEDILQPCAKGALFYKGESVGKWHAPTLACEVALGEGLVSAFPGDYDADGLLDIIVVGDKGWHLLGNGGGGLFRDITSGTGEADYSAQGQMTGGFTCDLNCDGREEVMFVRKTAPPQPFFSRGFSCFGFAEELDFKNNAELPAVNALGNGQSCGLAADFDGDGRQDVLMVSDKGEAWVLFAKPTQASRMGLTVVLPVGQGGTCRISAQDGKRSLGARVASAATPAFFGKREKGAIRLTWLQAGNQQVKPVMVAGPTRLVLPEPGAATSPSTQPRGDTIVPR